MMHAGEQQQVVGKPESAFAAALKKQRWGNSIWCVAVRRVAPRLSQKPAQKSYSKRNDI
jgi:hypothetical protein